MSELRFEWKNMLAADLGEESCVPDLLGEQILQNSLKFYLDETDEIYEGYGKVADSYPYRQRNNYKRQLKEKQIRTAVLENNQLKAVFLPDYGGRLWELWDKNENRNLLYTAVTRARKCVTLVGDEKTFIEMENNQMEQSRYTTLDLRIKESY